MELRRIIYTSKAREAFSKRNLLDLLHESRAYNSIDDITGVLMHKDGYFLQVIEGEPAAVLNLYNRILNDSRHSDVKLIKDSTVSSRLFSNWSMGCADFDEPELSMLPGIRTDLSDSEVVDEMIDRLPEVAAFLIENAS